MIRKVDGCNLLIDLHDSLDLDELRMLAGCTKLLEILVDHRCIGRGQVILGFAKRREVLRSCIPNPVKAGVSITASARTGVQARGPKDVEL